MAGKPCLRRGRRIIRTMPDTGRRALLSEIRLLETKNDPGSPWIWSPASPGGLQQDWCTSALRRRWIIAWVAVRPDGQRKCRGGPPVALTHLLPSEPCRSGDHQHNAAPTVKPNGGQGRALFIEHRCATLR
jgi:hypothetical protein